MQEDFHDALGHVRNLFHTLNNALKSKFDGATNEGDVALSQSLAEFRQASLALLRKDLRRAYNEDVDVLLWKAHTSVNDRFRVLLRKIDKKKEAVRWRVRATEYKTFIKESQVFYRQYARWLAEHGGIADLHQIAQNWRRADLDEPITTDHHSDFHDLATSLSHDCLMRLGDLSRWRYSTRVDGERSQPRDAVGYYELAEIVLPTSGAAQNQLAVLAAGDKHSFRALYHFYRSLAYAQPHDLALSNLELEFKKIGKLSDEDVTRSCMPSDRNESIARLRTWFIRLLAGSHAGVLHSQQVELEDEVIGRITHGLSGGDAYDATIEKIIIISICAEWHARHQRAADSGSKHDAAYFSSLRFNIRTLLTTLEQTETALDESFREDLATDNNQPNHAVDGLTKTAQKCLKFLHLQCLWFAARAVNLSSQSSEQSTDKVIPFLIQDVWRLFAAVLNALVEHFEINKIEILDYFLPEEELCLGLVAVQSIHTDQSWYIDEKLKARAPDSRKTPVDEHAQANRQSLETLARIRDIVTIGVRLAVEDETSQIAIDGTRFKYEDPAIPPEMLADKSAEPAKQQSAAGAIPKRSHVQSHLEAATEPFDGTIDMNEMVQNLLEDPDPVDRLPETPLMANFDDSVKISNSIQSLRLDGLDNPGYGSPRISKPRIPTPERRDNLPSPSLPSLSFYSNTPSYYGNDETWQVRPTSGPTYPAGSWLPPDNPLSGKETQRPHSRNRIDAPWGHSHHTSLPGFVAEAQQRFGPPLTPQVYAVTPGSSTVTGFNFAANTPSPTLDHAGFSHGPPPGVGPALHTSMAKNWISSHIVESSRPNPSFPSSWNRTPPSGQGG